MNNVVSRPLALYTRVTDQASHGDVLQHRTEVAFAIDSFQTDSGFYALSSINKEGLAS